MSRWLKRWVMAAGKPRRRRRPQLLKRPMREAQRCHDVWTVDFKGWYRTGNGLRVEPLTVRDLFSRYGLMIPCSGAKRWRKPAVNLRAFLRCTGRPCVSGAITPALLAAAVRPA